MKRGKDIQRKRGRRTSEILGRREGERRREKRRRTKRVEEIEVESTGR